MLLPGEVSLAPERALLTWMLHRDGPQKEHQLGQGAGASRGALVGVERMHEGGFCTTLHLSQRNEYSRPWILGGIHAGTASPLVA